MQKKALIFALVLIFLILGKSLLKIVAEDILFQPEKSWLPGFEASLSELGLQERFLLSPSGERIHVVWKKTSHEQVFLFCHGNAGNISYNSENIANLELTGRSYLLFDYPGYGKSDGRPSERGLYQSGQAAYDFLIDQGYRPDQIILSGQSLGVAVCFDIAARNEVRSVIGESGFLSTREVAKDMVGAVLALLIPDEFRNTQLIKEIDEPLLLIHGTDDQTLSSRHSKTMYELAHDPKYLLILEGLDHNEFIMTKDSDLYRNLEQFYNTSHYPQ